MKVTVSNNGTRWVVWTREWGRRAARGLCLLTAMGVAFEARPLHAAKYDNYTATGSAVAGGPVGGESVLLPGRSGPVQDESFSEATIHDGMEPNRPISNGPGSATISPRFAAECDPHPGLLAALYDRHATKVAERDAAGLPRRSTTGLVNRIIGEADPRWTAQADVLFLWQQPLDSRVLFTTEAGAPVFNVTDVPSTVGIGPRTSLALHLDCTHAIEANYFQVGGLGGTGTLPATADGTLYTMNDLVGYNFADVGSAEVTASAAIQSFELNWRRWNTGAFTWIMGFRWVEWNENLSIVDSYVPVDPLEPGGTDTFGVLTRNDLYGAQIGTDMVLWNAHKIVRFNAVGKAGVYYNASALQQTNVASDREPFDPISVSANGGHTAFFGELGIVGTVKLTEWLSWRAGYNFFWLSGVAVPSKQLSVTDPGMTPPTTAINMNGNALLYGANTGLEARW